MRFPAFLTLILLLAQPALAGPALEKAQLGKTLNCGFVPYAPAMVQDSDTKEWEGYDADFAKAIAARMHVTTQYTTQTNWGQMFEDLNSHKFDLFCATSWVNPEKAKFALFSKPLYYQPVFIITRADDTRFDGHPEKLNDPAVKIVALDGDGPVSIIKSDFPKAEMVTLPQIQSYSDTYVQVANGKADALIGDASMLGIFNKNNEGKLKLVNADKPIRIYPASFVVASDEIQLWHALNATVDELQLDGTLEKIMRKYIEYSHSYYPVGRDGKYIVVDKVKK